MDEDVFSRLPPPLPPDLRGLADDVCSMREAKEVYPALGMIANVGLVLAGAWAKFVNTNLAGEGPSLDRGTKGLDRGSTREHEGSCLDRGSAREREGGRRG